MGLFDAVRSLFGQKGDSDASDTDGSDAEAAESSGSGEAGSGDGDGDRTARADQQSTEQSTGTDGSDTGRADATEQRPETMGSTGDAGGPGNEIVGEADAANDISEWTFDEGESDDTAGAERAGSDAESEAGSDEVAETDATPETTENDDSGTSGGEGGASDVSDGGADDEPVSWEETGFEQLTTELVDEDEPEEEDDDPADLITEAEPDRADGDDGDGDSGSDADGVEGAGAEASGAEGETTAEAGADAASEAASGDDEMAAAVSAADESADRLDDVDAGDSAGTAADTGHSADAAADAGEVDDSREGNLPLGAEEGVADDVSAESGESVDVPEDSPRSDFVSEAVDLAEFWAEYDLDFTVGSLARVDEMIDDQWDPERFADAEFGGEGYDSEVFTEQVRAIGSYLGEVFVRTHGGEWVRQDGVGWTVDVQAGPSVDAAGATVTVFHIAQSALRGEASVAARHDGVVEQLDLDDRVGVENPTATLQQAGGHSQPRSADEDVVERFRAGAEDLADRWPDYDLDFSTASLDRLEALLADELEDGRFDDVELGDETDRDSLLLTAHAVGVGGYLAEVLRREHDADWVTDDRLIVVVEAGEQRHEIDPIEAAVDAIRGDRSLTDAVPGREP